LTVNRSGKFAFMSALILFSPGEKELQSHAFIFSAGSPANPSWSADFLNQKKCLFEFLWHAYAVGRKHSKIILRVGVTGLCYGAGFYDQPVFIRNWFSRKVGDCW
jgi:hypothetical protein